MNSYKSNAPYALQMLPRDIKLCCGSTLDPMYAVVRCDGTIFDYGCSLEVVPHSEHPVFSHCDRDRLGNTHVKGYDRRGVISPFQEGMKLVFFVIDRVHVS